MNKWPHKHPKRKINEKVQIKKNRKKPHIVFFFFPQLPEVGVGDEYPMVALVFIDDICLENCPQFSPDRLVAKS